jgi:hypothetical protein
MSADAHASCHSLIWIVTLLIQDLHHGCLFLQVFDEHASSSADVFDNIDDFAEARCGAARLGEAGEAEAGALTVLENHEELDYEGDGLHFEIYKDMLLAYW